MKKTKKTISILLALALVLALAAIPAAAVDMITFTVTFKVVGGKWDDGTNADIVVQLSRRADEDLLLYIQERDYPAVGKKPDEGYTTGSWDVGPHEQAVSRDLTFTYTYCEMTDRKISLDANDMENADTVWFGTKDENPIAWRVLSALNDTKLPDTSGGGEVLLISKDQMGEIQFKKDKSSNAWEGSDAQAWCTTLYANWPTGIEKSMIGKTTITETESFTDPGHYHYIYSPASVAPPAGANGNFFFLSAREADAYFAYDEDRLIQNAMWWLRSPYDTTHAGIVGTTGSITILSAAEVEWYATAGTRPAFNLNPSSVLFISDVDDGKLSADGALAAIPPSSTSEWKLTLHDANRDGFTVTGTETDAEKGGKVRLRYQNAATGANEYVSVLLCNANGSQTLAYGSTAALTDAGKASGTAELTLPAGLGAGTYQLYVFSEQKNAAHESDLSSAFRKVTLTVELPKAPTPKAVFTATGYDTGTLTGVSAGMKYQINKDWQHTGAWHTIEGDSVELSGLSEQLDPVFLSAEIKVYQPGDGINTSDSRDCPCAVWRAWTPTLTAAQPATAGETGSIPTTAAHEYRIAPDTDWTACTGALTGLAPGTYFVRVKAAGVQLTSDAQEIKITDVPTATVTWKNGDYVLGQDTVAYGLTPAYAGAEPTKAEDEEYTYTFSGWTPEPAPVTGDVTYTAVFTAKEKEKPAPVVDDWTPAPPKETRFDEVDVGKGGSLDNFKRSRSYAPGLFSDADPEGWYYGNVAAAYEFALMEGMGDGTFGVGKPLKLSEALALACRLHNIYYGGSGRFDQTKDKDWYTVYEDYAAKYGILEKGALDLTKDATRAQFARLVSAALPDAALTPINAVTNLPDVPATDPDFPAIARLYNAGILTGVDASGRFDPDAPMAREQIAAVVTRVADPALRIARQ